MKTFRFLLIFSAWALMCFSTNASAKSKSKDGKSCLYVVATDYVKADGKTDVADALQKLIEDNPNRTIFFPDGVYMLSHSLCTPADPTKSVHLVLGNYAVLKAMDNWQGGAVVRLGGIFPFNNTGTNGSNYGMEGGIVDGSKIADGVSIDSGRETRVNHVSIKNVQTGIWVKHGANNGSADADIVDCNVIGNKNPKSVGILVEGYDNTFSNIRLAGFNTGVYLRSGGNSLKNIHPLTGADYPNSCGFRIEGSNNWLDYCYSDHFAVGFKLGKGAYNHMTFCWVWWYSSNVPFQTGIECDGKLESYFEGLRTGFSKDTDCPVATLLKAEKGGSGAIINTRMPQRKFTDDDVSASYVK